MTKYTSPVSSPIGKTGEIPDELAILAALEAVIDAVRFRFEALDNDLAQERPHGAQRSMAEIIAQMRSREEGFVQQLSSLAEDDVGGRVEIRPSRLFLSSTDYQDDLGMFIQLRQKSLVILRRLTHRQWHLAKEFPEVGQVAVMQLARHIAEQDAIDLNDLADLRRSLSGGSIAGTAGVVPG
ncbi:MAG: hypothetical protein KatS3mg057_1078 [Herpetosiphonaceae bacterium]|nr:MAG: hypothetical protein KatS3mg057_1078 [Herpetosiphonaceae bacterium]